MWPARRDMNRDECRKYLRYLELDAYGSMVSVLRAQGPFTSEKQKLLQELARVLRISSERHRAEVRRAVNDEKLTQIAEQLGGPNTGIDWTIEGRRVIPLLPRLKARSAFTTLANSLSLATAAANDRKPHILEKIEQSKDIYESRVKIKQEESSSDTDEIVPGDDESSNERICLEQVGSVRQLDFDRQSNNHDIVQLSIASRKRKSPSPLPTLPPHKVLVISPGSIGNSNNCTEKIVVENTVGHLQASLSSQHDITLMPSTTSSNSSRTLDLVEMEKTNATNHTSVQTSDCISTPTMCTASTLKSKITPVVVQNKLNTKVVASHKVAGNSYSTSTSNLKSSTQNVQTKEESKVLSVSQPLQKKLTFDHITNTTSSCAKRVISVTTSSAKLGPAKVATSNNSQRVTAICPGTTVSSGPGPPHSTEATLSCKKLSTTLNPQTTTKTGVTVNSNKCVNISQHPNTKLATKTNVIVIQKGHTKGVTLSHAGKEVLGKVIMGGKNLCVTTQNSGNSVGVISQQVAMNNGDQSANVVSSRNSTHTESTNSNAKPGNTIVFNLRHDVSEKKKVLSQLLDSSSVLTSEPKTVIHNTNARSLKEQTNSDLCIIDSDETVTGSSSDENAERNDLSECENANFHEVNSIDSIDSLENAEIVIDTSQLTEENDVSDIELKQIMCTSEVEVDEKNLAATEISLDNVQYVVEGSENYILEETRSPILTISQTNVIDNTS